ncbi:helix-turn-helix domain-containing protein [Flavobacterium sp. ACAM 123]|jgi:excisionase family DNA binding protein|uniref:helix-turn-helix domain-containing protein n=1 Tax=Flavobacterium sp. ACAM 123 TaxID=1189620 RepID=UPI001E4777C4|nr:helix-turn-helix domain-containing protein [Flavobacterium sp. ACAM 123]
MPFSEILNLISDQVAEKILQNLNLSNSSHEDVFMNIDETAKLIDLSRPTVYGLVHKNKIPYHKKGKRLYFLKSEILAWLKSGKHQTKSEMEDRADAYLMKNKLF